MLARFKYYHAWLFADAICNNSGLGFNGYDERGNPRWDAVSNIDVYKFEVLVLVIGPTSGSIGEDLFENRARNMISLR
jgi:hypothetical protein